VTITNHSGVYKEARKLDFQIYIRFTHTSEKYSTKTAPKCNKQKRQLVKAKIK